MKLFGKRKSKASSEAATAEAKPRPDDVNSGQEQQQKQEDEEVTSYFSSDFKPPSASASAMKDTKKENGHDIEQLLKMDPSELNAKQRRIIRRHKERSGSGNEGGGEKDGNGENASNGKADGKVDKKPKEISKNEKESDEDPTATTIKSENDTLKSSKSADVAAASVTKDLKPTRTTCTGSNNSTATAEEIADQLKGLNSKERRKLLRRLASEAEENESMKEVLDQAVALSKKIAEENESKQLPTKKDSKMRDDDKPQQTQQDGKDNKTSNDATGSSPDIDEKSDQNDGDGDGDGDNDGAASTKPTKKRKWKDFSHLPPEERERREKQRKMQQEAAARRASGEEILTRHPLNSERRRANRRKPGRAGKIAALKKAQREKQDTLRMFNASGYNMRHAKKKTSSIS